MFVRRSVRNERTCINGNIRNGSRTELEPQPVGTRRMRLRLALPCILSLFCLSESIASSFQWMPPKSIVQCPCCKQVFATERAVRQHRSHPRAANRSCFLSADEPPRVISWGPGGAGRTGRVQYQDMFMSRAADRDSDRVPDAGDDLHDPPADFDEDGLGGPAPAPIPPPAPVLVMYSNQFQFFVRICTYLYVSVRILYVYVRMCTYWYVYVRICTYMYVYVRICTYAYVYVRNRTYAYVCVRICTYSY